MIRWFLDPRLLVRSPLGELRPEPPSHILIIVQNEEEEGTSDKGLRTLVPLDQGWAFVQFAHSGKNRITVVVLNQKDKHDNKTEPASGERTYKYSLPLGDVYEKIDVHEHGPYLVFLSQDAVAISTEVVMVPEELFSQVPRSTVGQWFWNWANGGARHAPIDDCDFRRRAIYALTLKPIFVLLRWTIFAPGFAIWFTFLRLLSLNLGFWPEDLRQGLKQLWTMRFNDWTWPRIFLKTPELNDWRRLPNGRILWVTPAEILIPIFLFVMYQKTGNIADLDFIRAIAKSFGFLSSLVLAGIILSFLGFFVGICWRILRSIYGALPSGPGKSEAEEGVPERSRWLPANLSTSVMSERLQERPRSLNRKFFPELSFSRLKANICRPFDRKKVSL